MTEPLTLFDHGLLRLKEDNEHEWYPKLLDEAKQRGLEVAKQPHGVFYSWENNEITIGSEFYGPTNDELCTSLLKRYLDIIAPFRNSRKFTELLIGGFFHHYGGWGSKSQPESLERDMAGIIRLRVGIRTLKPREKVVFCESGLFDETPKYWKKEF
jgi:hypothetical protein